MSIEIYNQFLYTTYTEMLRQNVTLFNEQTRGALLLTGGANIGDKKDTVSYAKIPNMIAPRKVGDTTTPISKETIGHLVETSVKVPRRTPLIEYPANQLRWIQESPEIAGAVTGKQLALDTLADQVNTAIMCLVTCLGASPNVLDTADPISLIRMMKATGKMGDAMNDVSVWVMHSASAVELFGQTLTNHENLFQFGTVNIIHDGFGRPIIVTDSPSLMDIGGGKSYALGLTAGGATVENNGDFFHNTQTVNGAENIQLTYQAEWSYQMQVKGYAYAGPVQPDDSILAVAANWKQAKTSNKDLAGVLLGSAI